ncbi:MAG: dihydropteroate synthase [Ignavibacteriales bacterium]|nr:dihydropteroate synthase [Ignavibacteriales bacterium]
MFKVANFTKPLIMGIVNLTPDSFSDGGKFSNIEQSFAYAAGLIEQGIDIIDIGGESSRPNADPVTPQEEIDRVMPLIEKLVSCYPKAVISIDTYRSSTARAALQNGVQIVNDISGGLFDPEILTCTASFNAAYIAMHMKGNPKTMQDNPVYADVVAEVNSQLAQRANEAKSAGINEIIVDPGIGFGKTVEHNFALLRSIPRLKLHGYPVLIGLSRKSFIGKLLDVAVEHRDTPTAMLEMYASLQGADIIRTHNCTNALHLKKLFTRLQND